MKLHEYARYDATGLAGLVRKRDITAVELVRLAREAHDQINPAINGVIEFYDDAETVTGSDTGPFCGVPFLRKDTGPSEAGRLQEQGSRLLQGHRPAVESYFMERARSGGLRILGRTTMPEFGTRGSSESLACGITRNPWNLDLTAGGSSSGSAAVVAAGVVPIAHASDGAGSIRIPASLCGLVGLNPSRGRISGGPNKQDAGYGNVRDFVVCRSVRDMAAALDVLHGPQPGDPFVIASPERPYVEELEQPSNRLRVGMPTSPPGTAMGDPDIRGAVEKTAKLLESMGHLIEEIPPLVDFAEYGKVLAGMAHMRFSSLDRTARALGRDINEETLEPHNLELYHVGKQLPLAYAQEIFEGARKIRSEVGEATKDFDILLTPTMLAKALPHDRYRKLTGDELMDAELEIEQHLAIFNITGQPSVSLPLFQSVNELPIGIQIVGRFGDEATLVRIARDLERAVPWSTRRPPVFAGYAG
ncbi:amidase (plasmid) [Ensifer sp. WSM1721]|uniref:amidase n=1 Tax=Ensifer sp. WSM1721 TaxID=1041159 RepID=UPI0004787DAD|nr:amidase [Ensifer sp. WSM1721]